MVTRVRLLTATLMVLAAGLPAAAADVGRMPMKAPVVAPVPLQDWTGLYVGANAGYSWGRTDTNYALGGIPALGTPLDPNSFVGGGQIGYNWQMGSLVLGVEGDLAWRHGTDAATFTTIFGDFAAFNTEQNWAGTVRPRVGFATNNWLLYGTGGVAFGGFKHGYTEMRPGVATRAAADSDTKAGWAAGAGVEYAFAPQWSLGVEYLYMDFGDATLAQPVVGALPASSANFDDKSHLLRAKLNYKFNWNTPLAGKN
jgi:outer membrane immunogenic protein